jgi:chromate transporter
MIGSERDRRFDPVYSGNSSAGDRVGLAAIFLAFFRLGCTSFGGGSAGWIYREIIQRRGWADNTAFLAALSVSQALPGANGIKMAGLIGDRLHGPMGAVTAVSALLVGPLVIILALGQVYAGIGDHRWMSAVLDGVAAAAIGLTFATGLQSLVKGGPSPFSIAIGVVTVICVGVFRWPILPVLAVLAPISIGASFLHGRSS